MAAIGWCLWAVSLLLTLLFIWSARGDAKSGRLVHVSTVLQAMLFCCAVIFFGFSSASKFHLLWALPSCWFFGLILGFIMVPMPVVGPVLCYIVILFSSVAFYGTDWRIGGYPWERATERTRMRKLHCTKDGWDPLLAEAIGPPERIPTSFHRTPMKQPDAFRATIRARQDYLFGVMLYYETAPWFIRWFWRISYPSLLARNVFVLLQAQELLRNVEAGHMSEDCLSQFSWPRWTKEMDASVRVMLEAYNAAFLGRPLGPLSRDELSRLREVALDMIILSSG